MMMKYFSRKFILTVLISILAVAAPVTYKAYDVSDMVTLSVLALLGGVGAAYGFINIKAKGVMPDAPTKQSSDVG